MKLLFLCAATAFAAAPPRIELDIAQAEKLSTSIYRPHNDGLRQPNGDAVLSRQDYTERCAAGSSTFKTCPFPVAKAWDHQDKDISHRIVTRVYKVDQDGMTCGTTADNFCGCAKADDTSCEVHAVDFAQRSTYLFKYDVTDRSGNHAEQVVFALILDDLSINSIEGCGAKAETWEAASKSTLTTSCVASDNIDTDAEMAEGLMYDVQDLDIQTNAPLGYVCKNQSYKTYKNYRASGSTQEIKPCAAVQLDTSKVGHYLVTFHVCDHAGVYGKGSTNNCISTRKAIVIQDTLSPWIDVHGFEPTYQECHKHSEKHANCADRASKDCWAYEDAGATAHDRLDTEKLGLDISKPCGNGPRKGCLLTEGEVNSALPNTTYTITYTAYDNAFVKDGNSNSAVETRKVNVKDTRAPTATLREANRNPIIHYPSQTSPDLLKEQILAGEQGFDCNDDCDTTPTKSVSWDGREYSCTAGNCPLGDYVRKYTCTDATGHSHSVSRTFTVMDQHKPIIEMQPGPQGGADMTLEASVDQEYTDFGATCRDFIDGELSHAVEVSGQVVNYRIPGVYRIRYDCQDLSGNQADFKERVVTIQDTTCPTIEMLGNKKVYVESGFTYTDAGAKASDTLDGDITSKVYTYQQTVNAMYAFKQFRNCKQIKAAYPKATSGPYRITSQGKEVTAMCDMDTGVGFTYGVCSNCKRVVPYGNNHGDCGKFGMEMADFTNRDAQRKWAAHPYRFGKAFFPEAKETSEMYLCSTNDDKINAPAPQTYGKLAAYAGTFTISYFVEDRAGNNQETRADGTWCGVTHSTPSRTVIVQDTLAPVITLHMDKDQMNNNAETRVHMSDPEGVRAQVESPSEGQHANPAGMVRDVNGFGNPFLVSTYKAQPLTQNAFMAEQGSSTNAWLLGALASAVAGVALLATSRTRRTETTVAV